MASNTSNFWPQWSDNRLFSLLLAILLVYTIVFMGVAIRKNLAEARTVGMNDREAPTISVTATGKASVANDLAYVDLGVTTRDVTAAEAQDKNNSTANKLIEGIKALGVDAKDIQTSSYNVYQTYRYNDDGSSEIDGYEASQSITVKIREQALQSKVLGAASELGATNVGGLRFATDDETVVQSEARKEAIEKAREQAREIARAMGARLGKVVSYSESFGGGYPVYYDLAADSRSAMAPSPTIEPGENEVNVTVYINFAIE